MEAVVAVSVFLVLVLGLFGSFNIFLTTSLSNINKIQASFLEEEGLEAMRVIRDNGWTANIASQASGVPFYLYFNGTNWVSTTSVEYIGGMYERKVILTNATRNVSQDIVSGGTPDPKTKLVTVQVSWSDHGATTTRSLQTYLTNVYNN